VRESRERWTRESVSARMSDWASGCSALAISRARQVCTWVGLGDLSKWHFTFLHGMTLLDAPSWQRTIQWCPFTDWQGLNSVRACRWIGKWSGGVGRPSVNSTVSRLNVECSAVQFLVFRFQMQRCLWC
jgi:hypothetical protein